ncbi:MAG: DUF4276 family protein [Planctomycetes bacterium]|nr:DUF4276 family protein [Planctomycetota bacterium]
MRSLVVFTEEVSAKVMLESLLPRLLPQEKFSFVCVAFEGKQDLEKQLPIKLRGWRAPETRFIILRDQDNGDCKAIKKTLLGICTGARKSSRTLVRIVCRELESWYIGDLRAVETALEIDGLSILQEKEKYRKPDRMKCPSKELKRMTKNRYQKISGSRLIGEHLSLDNSRSKSFHHFISGVRMVMNWNAM